MSVVSSRVESFIEHQDACNMGRIRSESHSLQPAACLSRTASSPSPSSDTNLSAAAPWPVLMAKPIDAKFLISPVSRSGSKITKDSGSHRENLDLRLLTTTSPVDLSTFKRDEDYSTQLQLSIGSSNFSDRNDLEIANVSRDGSRYSPRESSNGEKPSMAASRLEEEARDQLAAAMAEKAYSEEARKQAKRQIEVAEKEFANAKRIRQQAQAELEKAIAFKEQATKKINATILEITCHACKDKFQAARTTAAATAMAAAAPRDHNSLALSYVSSSALTIGEVEKGDRIVHPKFALC